MTDHHKPSSTTEWAENADPSDISEPSAERPRGFKQDERLPHDQVNWLFRELWNWIDFFEPAFVGDQGLIDFFNGIDFGDHAEARKNEDTSSDWIAELYNDFGGNATLQTDYFEAFLRVITDVVESKNQLLEIATQASGEPGIVLDILKPKESDNLIEVWDINDDPGGGRMFVNSLKGQSDYVSFEGENSAQEGTGGTYMSFIKANTSILKINNDSIQNDDKGEEGHGGLLLGFLRPGTSSPVTIEGPGGSGAGVLELDQIENKGNTGEVVVNDLNGNVAEGGLKTSRLRAGGGYADGSNYIPFMESVDGGSLPVGPAAGAIQAHPDGNSNRSGDNRLYIDDETGEYYGRAEVHALNTFKAWAVVNANDGSVVILEGSNFTDSYIAYEGAGVFTVSHPDMNQGTVADVITNGIVVQPYDTKPPQTDPFSGSQSGLMIPQVQKDPDGDSTSFQIQIWVLSSGSWGTKDTNEPFFLGMNWR